MQMEETMVDEEDKEIDKIDTDKIEIDKITKKGEKRKKLKVELTEEEKEFKKARRRRKVETGVGRIGGVPIQDSGGYCTFEEKTKILNVDDDFNIIDVTVNGITLNIDYGEV